MICQQIFKSLNSESAVLHLTLEHESLPRAKALLGLKRVIIIFDSAQ